MDSVLTFLTAHDLLLVLLAILAAGAASFVTFVAYAHLLARSSGRHGGWLLITALCAGIGIWAPHVIMALSLTVEKQAYRPLLSVLALATAIVTAIAGIGLSSREGRGMAAAGGAILGVGIVATHFVGMGAFQIAGAQMSDALAGLAAALAVCFCAAAMLASREYMGKRAVFTASALLTTGVAGFLLVALASIAIPATASPTPSAERNIELILAVGAALLTAVILVAGYVAAELDGRALKANFAQFGELVDSVVEGIIVANDGVIVGANARALELTGRKLHELEGQKVLGDLLATKRKLTAPGAIRKFDATLNTAAAEITVPVQVVRRPLHAMARANEVYVIRDLRERSQAGDRIAQLAEELAECQQDLRRRNFLLEGVLSNMSEGLCMFDADQRVVVSNERYGAIFNLSPEATKPGTHLREVIQRRIDKGLYAGTSPKAYMDDYLEPIAQADEVAHELNDGRVITIHRRPMPGGGWITTYEDITDQRRMEQENLHLTEHDTLTMLPNRGAVRKLLDETLGGALRKKRKLAVLMLNIDHFREVNDTLGHATGDALLRAVADRLRSHTRKATLLARFGDDEFVLVEAVDQPGRDAAALAGRIQEQLRLPYNLDGTVMHIDTTVGIAIAPADGKDADTLLKRADLALYRAKQEARGTHYFFDNTMERHLKERMGLEQEIVEALSRGEFEMYYQPLVSIPGNQITGFEALLRWNRPGRGLVTPDVFMPVAEAAGLMPAIGEWALRQACNEAAGWPAPLRVGVNISPSQFKSRDFVRTVIGALAASGLTAQRLELEFAEGLLQSDDMDAQTTLRQLSDAGVRIAIDDFGAGFASLGYLRRYPVQRVKIDRSFVGTLSDPDSQVVLRILMRLGASMKVDTAAEGVETQEQLDLVRAEGCTEMQGYLFSAPKSAQEIRALFLTKGADSAVA